MKKLSTGDDSTLASYRKLASLFFGERSKAVQFIDAKISISPDGQNEEVFADESQMVNLLYSMAHEA